MPAALAQASSHVVPALSEPYHVPARGRQGLMEGWGWASVSAVFSCSELGDRAGATGEEEVLCRKPGVNLRNNRKGHKGFPR